MLDPNEDTEPHSQIPRIDIPLQVVEPAVLPHMLRELFMAYRVWQQLTRASPIEQTLDTTLQSYTSQKPFLHFVEDLTNFATVTFIPNCGTVDVPIDLVTTSSSDEMEKSTSSEAITTAMGSFFKAEELISIIYECDLETLRAVSLIQ